MRAFYKVAVLVVSLAVGHEHPEALHDLAVGDHFAGVGFGLVPDVLGDALEQFKVLLVGVEALLRVALLGLLGQLGHCQLVVLQKQKQEVVYPLDVQSYAVLSNRTQLLTCTVRNTNLLLR